MKISVTFKMQKCFKFESQGITRLS